MEIIIVCLLHTFITEHIGVKKLATTDFKRPSSQNHKNHKSQGEPSQLVSNPFRAESGTCKYAECILVQKGFNRSHYACRDTGLDATCRKGPEADHFGLYPIPGTLPGALPCAPLRLDQGASHVRFSSRPLPLRLKDGRGSHSFPISESAIKFLVPRS